MISIYLGAVFFVVNIISALIYSALEVIEDKEKLMPRVWRDALFILIIFLSGILPTIGLY